MRGGLGSNGTNSGTDTTGGKLKGEGASERQDAAMRIDPFPHDDGFVLAANIESVDTSQLVNGSLNQTYGALTFSDCWSEERGEWVSTATLGTHFDTMELAVSFLSSHRKRMEAAYQR